MKIMEIVADPAQLKVIARKKGSDNAPRTLLLDTLDSSDPVGHVKSILKKISDRFVDSPIRNIKVIQQDPLIFNVIPEQGNDYYQFLISFPPHMANVQKGLITSINKFVDTPKLH